MPASRLALLVLGPLLLGPSLAGADAPPAPSSVAAVGPSPDAEAERAVEAFAAADGSFSRPEALRTAARAYYAYRDAHPERVRKPLLYLVDLGLDNRTARGWVFDMDRLAVVEGPFNVAHGRGSSASRNGVPTTFSNRSGSKASSVGVYLARGTYSFRGRVGGQEYRSVGLRLQGESGSFNDAATERGIVVHGAPYVTATDAGRSEGCPAMEMARAERLLPELAGGGVVIVYSPLAEEWLASGPWVATAAEAAHD